MINLRILFSRPLVWLGTFACILIAANAGMAQTTTYQSAGGLSGQFQQLSPRTPAFEISARGSFVFDSSRLENSQFDFILAGIGSFQDLGDIVRLRSTRYVGNRNGQLLFQVVFEGANGGRTTLGPSEASLLLVNPRTIPAGQSPQQMELRLQANTATVKFDLPIRLTR